LLEEKIKVDETLKTLKSTTNNYYMAKLLLAQTELEIADNLANEKKTQID